MPPPVSTALRIHPSPLAGTSHPRAPGEGLGESANSVLGKARLIVEAFEMEDDDLSLSELARRTGIAKASVHRLAGELLEWGVLERSGCSYRLGMRVFELGARVPRMRILREAVRPFMEDLHAATKETVHLAVRDGLDVLYIEKVTARGQQTRPSRVAGRMPLYCTATGKVLLAFGPPDLLPELVSHGLERITRATVVWPQLLIDQARKTRQTGVAVEREETVNGYLSVAVPLFGVSGMTIAALSVTAPTFRADVPRYSNALLAVSRKLQAAQLLN